MYGSKFLSVLLAGLVSIPVASVMAQASAYAQCGGSGFTGPTTCVSGYKCQYSNDWYSQCVPGTAAAVTTTTTAAVSTPTTPISATAMCGQWDNVQTSNGYILYNNLWGSSAATSGSQCTELISTSGTSISWKTSWSWAGGPYNVKSFANANLVFTPKKISAIASIPSTVKFTYSGTSGMVANVAYDIFTSSTSGGDAEYEIMIWLAAYGGAGPISSSGSPIATVTLAGQSWNLYKGPNGAMTVFSFVATAGVVSNFSGDAKTFLTYLTTSQGMPTSQFVNTVQCGTEPFLGSGAVLNMSAFSVAVN